MAKSFELENKIENLKAHYSVIKSKVNQIAQETNDAIEAKENALMLKASIEDEIDEKQSQLSGLRRTLVNFQTELKETIQEIEDSKELKREIEEEHEESLDAILEAIEEGEGRLKHLNKEFSGKRQEFLLELLDKKHELSIVENRISDLNEKISEKKTEYQQNKQKADQEQLYVESAREAIDEEYEVLNGFKKRLKEREDKLADRFKEYNERQKELERKEADAKVYFNRLKAAYRKIKPDVVIKI